MKINKSQMLLDSVVRLLRRDASSHIKRLLAKSHPSEIAFVVRQLSEADAIIVVNQIRDSEKESPAFAELGGKFIETYVGRTGDKEHIASVLNRLPKDEAAQLLAEAGEEAAQEILSLMSQSSQQGVSELLEYGEETCGRIMAVNVFALNQNFTAGEAIQEIQKGQNLESLFYIYIIDDYRNLVGVVNMRQLLQVNPQRALKDFMTPDVIAVNRYDSQERAAHLVEEYNFVSLPVVNDEGRLMGMVTVDDVIDYIRDEAQEEVLQLAGVEPEAIEDFSLWRALGSKLGWYGLLFLGGVLCSEIILYFFRHFPREVAYLCFAPLVLRLGGSVATQSVTMVYQGILSRDVERGRAVKALWGQSGMALAVAFFLAVAIFVYAHFRFANPLHVPLGLATGLVVVTLFSTVAGLVLPFVFHHVRFDPLQASSRFVHFLMDALNLLVFFKFLRLWQ